LEKCNEAVIYRIRYLLKLLEVKLGEAEIPWGTDKAIFNITGKINRKEWGLNWNAVPETGGVLAGEDVLMSCEVLIAKEP
jgi:hypothetical protein